MVPAIAFGVGVIVKLVLNILLVPIPSIGVNGAAIGTIACNIVACIIGFSVLRKSIKIRFSFSKYIVKPIISTIIMSVCSYAIYIGLNKIFSISIASILAILSAIIIYVLAIIALKLFTKEEIYMIPYGQKLYRLLLKFGIYKEENTQSNWQYQNNS